MPGVLARVVWIRESGVGSVEGVCLGLRGDVGGSSASESLVSAHGVGGRSVNGVLGRSLRGV